MGKNYNYDIIVIGGGAAGITAARNLAKAKKKVALIEARRLGGASLNYRDIPYAAALNFAHLYAEAMAGVKFGITSTNLRYNYPTAQKVQLRAIAKAGEKVSKKILEEEGITCISGLAHFMSSEEISVRRRVPTDLTAEEAKAGDNGQTLRAAKFLIATGSVPKVSEITGLKDVPHYTPETVLRIERLPKSMMVIGGGSSGVEIAEYFAGLGVKVVIVELAERLLPREDEEVGQLMAAYLEKRLGVKILTKTRAVAAQKDTISPRITLAHGGQEKAVRVECVVAATGSKPNTDLGLDNAKVKFDTKGIYVEKTLQTTAKNIYAAGDVVGGDSATELANYEAGVAAANMLGRNRTLVNYNGFTRTVNTNPQIATVGMTEDDLVKRDLKYNKAMLPLSAVTASVTSDLKLGFIKMLSNSQGKVLGATMMAPNAAANLQEIALCIRHGLSVVEVASTPHPNDDWGELVRLAAKKLV
ncbi:NAD(P)/FAD-dependent oxidoreductase [Candidatus Saccharibacteria bacterium]|nr:NAD(P)/FAD-dependent oxidoreductase [Candidatus Saccharibacteria bacterium]MBQ3467923.1 NAD(P)/FAD-dependent oxidoreductase [Candidatus Saccharibacteria bacterium]